jgi:outer membrane protein insertion porin family
MKPFGKPLRGSLLAAMVAASQLAWLPLPAAAQDVPPEYGMPGREIASERGELPGPMGDRPIPGTRPLVVDVVVKGTRNQEKALNNIRTKREYEYDPAQLQADVRRLITSQQYRNVRTYLRNVDAGVVVIFEIVDRPRIESIEFLGNRGAGDKKCLKTVNLKVGEPLNTYEVEEGRRKLEELYRGKLGYPNAVVGILEGDQAEDQAVVYTITEGYKLMISSVTFEGNTFASDGQLKTKVTSKPGYLWVFMHGKFDRAKLDADVAKLTTYYRDFGFFRARVGRQLDFDDSGKWVKIKFIIDEGPRYNVRSVAVLGSQSMRTQPLLEALKLKDGKPYNSQEMERDLQLMRDLYGSQGKIFADVTAEPRFLEEPGQLDLVYKIKEGEAFRVGEIHVHIAGEFPHTRRNVVLNRMSLRPGDLIDIRQIRDSERRLKYSQLFETEQTPGGEPPRVVVRPPELKDAAIAGGSPGALRGQSPDDPPVYDVDVFTPPLRQAPPPTNYQQ